MNIGNIMRKKITSVAEIEVSAAQVESPVAVQLNEDMDRIKKFILDNTEPDYAKTDKKLNAVIPKKYRPWLALRQLYIDTATGLRTPYSALIFKTHTDSLLNQAMAAVNGHSYSYAYCLEAPALTISDTSGSLQWITIGSAHSSKLGKYFSALSLKNTSSVKVVSGKYADLHLLLLIDDKTNSYITCKPRFFIGIRTDPSQFQDVFNAFNSHKMNNNRILDSVYHSLLLGRPIPSFFFSKSKLETQVPEGAYVTPSGTVLYIPDMNRKEIQVPKKDIASALQAPPDKEGRLVPLPESKLYFPDAESETMICTDSLGKLKTYSLVGLAHPDRKYRLYLLNDKVTDLTLMNQGTLRFNLNFQNDQKSWGLLNAVIGNNRIDAKISDVISSKPFIDFLEALREYGWKKYGTVDLPRWLAFMGMVQVYYELIDTADDLIREDKIRREKFEAVTADDAPAIPNMRPNGVQFPHQAEALAKLDIAADSAIIDIATGGGKAGILIQDCINLLNKGVIKKPLIVMPNSLIGQFLAEITFFTAGQVNGFAITTDVEGSWGREKLEEAISNAPKNTIFITSFSFLKKGGKIMDYDMEGNVMVTFESVRWLKHFGIDYIAVDESQNIKHIKSATFQAVAALGRGIPYKRISTGTLISNKPVDLVGQMMFLDPMLLGSEKNFAEKYALGGNLKNGFRAGFAEQIRERLRTGSAYIMYREKDWASLLPKKHYSFVRVPLSPQQAKIYKSLVQQILDEIYADPGLRDAWEKMKKNNEDIDDVPANLLGKMAKLEIFLTAPDSSTLMQYADPNAVSAKMEAVDNLIAKSLAMKGPNNKVIVATHFKDPAKHLFSHSKYKRVAAYYDASHKEVLSEFQDPKSNVKVLFAVIKSMTEGLNLQIANRIIVTDIDWAPGNLKQLEARIFRPHVNANLENLNKDKEVFIDTVIADDSADCVKYATQIFKKILNSVIMENCVVEPPQKVQISDDTLVASFYDPLINGRMIEDRAEQFNDWNQEVIEEYAKKADLRFRAVKDTTSNIGSEIINTPWIPGMELPAGPDEEPLVDYLEELGMSSVYDDIVTNNDEDDIDNSGDLSIYRSQLTGCRVRVERGEGFIYSVMRKSIVVMLDSGEKVSRLSPAVILHKKGSVATGLPPRSVRTMLTKQAGEPVSVRNQVIRKTDSGTGVRKHNRNTPTNISVPTGDARKFNDSGRNLKLIKELLESNDIAYARNADKTAYILTHNGNGLKVHTPNGTLRDLSFGQWKKLISQFVEGEIGSPDIKAPVVNNTKKRVNLNPKTRTVVPIDLDDDMDEIESNLENNNNTPTIIPNTSDMSSIKDDLEKYLDDEDEILSPHAEEPEIDLDDDLPASNDEPEIDLDEEEEEEKPSIFSRIKNKVKEVINPKSEPEDDTDLDAYLDEEDDLPANDEPEIDLDDESDSNEPEIDLDDESDSNEPEIDLDDESDNKDEEDEFSFLDEDEEKEDNKDEDEEDEFSFLDDLDDEPETPSISLRVGTYDDYPCLIYFKNPDASEAETNAMKKLPEFGFRYFKSYWMYHVKNKANAAEVLKKLMSKFSIPKENLKAIREVTKGYSSGKYNVSWLASNYPDFVKAENKNAPNGTLRLAPLTINNELYFVAEADKHPGVTLSNYHFAKQPGCYMAIANTQAVMKEIIRRVTEDNIEISNLEEVKSNAKKHYNIAL